MSLKEELKLITPLSHGLPKTGQISNYRDGDDGQLEIGWWLRRKNADNKTRFLVKTIDGDEVVIDLATGLMWARDSDADGCNSGNKLNWTNSITYCNDLAFAGYTDWRLPNITELFSITNHETYNPAIWDSFTNVKYDDNYWSSTTRKFATTNARSISFSEGSYYTEAKTATNYLRAVRGFV